MEMVAEVTLVRHTHFFLCTQQISVSHRRQLVWAHGGRQSKQQLQSEKTHWKWHAKAWPAHSSVCTYTSEGVDYV